MLHARRDSYYFTGSKRRDGNCGEKKDLEACSVTWTWSTLAGWKASSGADGVEVGKTE